MGLLLDAAMRCSAMGPVGRVVLNRSSHRAASLVGWGLFGGRQRAASGKDKCQPTKCATYYYRIYPVIIVIEL